MRDKPLTAEEIQERMATLRRSMSHDVEQIRDSSETMLDWRYYFKRYPWPMVAAAAAVGFLAVPKRVEVVRPTPKDLARLAKHEQIVIKQAAETKPQKGLGALAFGLLANALVRAGTAYVGQQAGKVFGAQAASNGRPHATTTNSL